MTQDTKSYLRRARHLDNDISSKLREKETVMASLFTASSIKEDVVQEGSHKTVEDKYIRLIEIQKEIDEYIDNLYAFKQELTKQIDKVPDGLCKSVLRDYYINNLSWETVAELNGQSVRNIYNIHGEALKLFREVNSVQ